MQQFFIKRQEKELGPFTGDQIKTAFQKGQILKKDLIRHSNSEKCISVSDFFKHNGLILSQSTEDIGTVFTNFFKLVFVFLNFPKYMGKSWNENKIIIFLSSIVLIPVGVILFSSFPEISYSIFGLYFALIWALILYKTIGTDQVKLWHTIALFFATIIFSIIFINILHSTPFRVLVDTALASENLVVKFIAMFIGVGLVEEFCKQLFVYILILKSPTVISTKTAIFYGMICGLAFGIFEGVEYQMGVNKTMDVDMNYYYNLLRLTSLPFFHAIWAGIGAFFISLSFIDLRYNISYKIIGLILPAFIHATYNSFGWTLPGIGIIIIATILLMTYLARGKTISLTVNKIN